MSAAIMPAYFATVKSSARHRGGLQRQSKEEDMQVDRREFLKGTAAIGAGALAGSAAAAVAEEPAAPSADGTWSFEQAPDPIPDDEIGQTVDAAIVVIGAGPSGFSAALSALDAGEPNVVVVAKSPSWNAMGGSIHAYNTTYAKSMGFGHTSDEISHNIRKEMLNQANRGDHTKWARAAFASGEAFDWAASYVEAAGGRVVIEIGPQDEDGIYQTGPVSHSFLGGSITQAGGGISLFLAAAEEAILQKGGTIYYDTRVEQLVREDNNTGRVSGCVASTADGGYIRFNASKGIIMACGCISHDNELLARYAPEVLDAVNAGCTVSACPTNTGDGLKMALWAGAAAQKNWPWACNFQTPPMHYANEKGSMWAMYRPYTFYPCLAVNQNGKRYMNEDAGMGVYPGPQMRQPGMMSYAIWTANMADELAPFTYLGFYYGDDCDVPSLSAEEVKQGWENGIDDAPVVPAVLENAKFDTLDELAEHFDIPAETLKETVANYNSFCEQGYDPECGKRSGLLIPVLEGEPIYCMKYLPLIANVFGGPRCDAYARVLDADDQPIEGLYEVGVMMGDLYQSTYTYLFPGANMGFWNITYGYLTGKGLAEGTI